MPQTNPKVTNIALNAKGGAFTLIAGTKMSSKVEIMEDPATAGGDQQGLTGYIMDPNSKGNPTPSNPNIQVWLPNSAGQVGWAYEPIIFGGDSGRVHGAYGLYTGADGTPYLQLTTNSGAAGGILLVEWD
jgi:hypothetical protein